MPPQPAPPLTWVYAAAFTGPCTVPSPPPPSAPYPPPPPPCVPALQRSPAPLPAGRVSSLSPTSTWVHAASLPGLQPAPRLCQPFPLPPPLPALLGLCLPSPTPVPAEAFTGLPPGPAASAPLPRSAPPLPPPWRLLVLCFRPSPHLGPRCTAPRPRPLPPAFFFPPVPHLGPRCSAGPR